MGLDKRVLVWDITVKGNHDKPLCQLQLDSYALANVVVAPNRVISSCKDKTLVLWDCETGRVEQTIDTTTLPNAPRGPASCLALSPDNTLLAAGYYDNCVMIWNLQSMEVVRVLQVHNQGIFCLVFLHNRTIVVGTSTGHIQLLPF